MPCIFAKEPKKFHKSFWLVCLFVWFVSFFVCATLSLFLTLSLSPALFITQFHFIICDNYFCCTLHQTKRKRHKQKLSFIFQLICTLKMETHKTRFEYYCLLDIRQMVNKSNANMKIILSLICVLKSCISWLLVIWVMQCKNRISKCKRQYLC